MFLKKLLTFFVVLISSLFILKAYSQTSKTYSAEWKKVEDFLSKGLSKSALEEVNKIYQLAKKDNNDPQIIKTLLFRVSLQRTFEEDATVKSILELEKEIAQAKEPAKSILHSIVAQLYWNYFQQNRWKLYQRTNTVDFKKDDLETWTIDDFAAKTSALFLQSIANEKLLQQTRLEPFDVIIQKGNARELRPTLFDLLAHRALDFFKNEERSITKPAYAFQINDQAAFANAEKFASQKFSSKDTSSLHLKALQIYQELIRFHLQEKNPDALIDVDVDRIQFVKSHSVSENKEQLFRQALQQIVDKYSSTASSAIAAYLIAESIYNKGGDDDKSSLEQNKYAWRDARKMLEQIVKQHPKSEGGIRAQNLLLQILRKEISLTSEKVNVPGQPFRTVVGYRNFSKVHFRIIPITAQQKKQLEEGNYDSDQRWLKVTKLKASRTWSQELPATDDNRTHNVEVKVDELGTGQYVLLSSVSEDFSLGNNPMALHYFHVSNISYINNGDEYFVLDRESGQPLAAAKVQIWVQRYDYKTSQSILEKREQYTTDKNGYFKITTTSEYRNLRLEIEHRNDKLFLDEYVYSYRYTADEKDEGKEKYEKQNRKFFLFTDRSIYRPGQLAYVKGIGVTKDYSTKKPVLVTSGAKFTVVLYDPNGQKVDSARVTLSEYGSFNHSFRIPENRLNGMFRISIDGDDQYISVEEYKRPKFLVDFEKVKGTYKVNDNIKVVGIAKAYAGNNVDGAVVKYRVRRVARFLYSWIWWRIGLPSVRSMEITSGEVRTGPDGKFSIEFKAIPDLSVDRKFDPVFDYKVEADVTDINGETRSSAITVPVGYKALDLQLSIPGSEPLPVDSFSRINVLTRNLSGEFEATDVTLSIFKLTPPDRLIRSRYWGEPDQFIMSKEEYLKYFPHDEYKDETRKETWARSAVLKTINERTTDGGAIRLGNINLSEGWYLVEATAKDKYGQEVKNVVYVQLYDRSTSTVPWPTYQWDATIKTVGEPGETAKYIAGTAAKDVFLIQQIDRTTSGNNVPDRSSVTFHQLDNSKRNFDFPVTEADRGGFGVYQFFVKHNRSYNNTWNVLVPWTNKQLDISFETYRDKTLPGSQEKWKVKIAGKKGEKIAAEMLASMYDASLDQFKGHAWSGLNVWPTFAGYNNWQGSGNFAAAQSDSRWWEEKYLQEPSKSYDELDLDQYQSRQYKTSGRVRGLATQPQMQEVVVTATGSASRKARNEAADANMSAPTAAKESRADTTRNFSIAVADDEPTTTTTADIQVRKNFNETAFFFPELKTDKDGNVEFSFTMPEALTQWKLMLVAHSRELASSSATKLTITQKDLMVQPFAPRFLREGDKIEFSSKIVNLGTAAIKGQAELQLFNATTMSPVDALFKNSKSKTSFNIEAGQSGAVSFSLDIPLNYANALVYRIVARAGNVSDGEENTLPVLTNRMLVTETMPLRVRGNVTKTFTFEKLSANKSSTLSHHALTVEFTTNPAWLVVQALPFLSEPKYECADQMFNRFYANALAQKIANSSPRIKAIFEKWKNYDTAALLSNLQKNQELKSILLQETPWVLQAKSEEQQKKNIALLFDVERMSNELQSSLEKLRAMQSSNGGFVWFKGGPDDRYMTQYIVTGLGHLQKLGAIPASQESKVRVILQSALPYLDRKMKEEYDNLVKYKTDLKQDNLSYTVVQYLYMRSFFSSPAVLQGAQTAFSYYKEQAQKYWLKKSRYMQGMIALALYRNNDQTTAKAITRSLKENAIVKEELGMYWNEWTTRGYFWYQAPIESQALMIEAFHDIDKDMAVVDDLKTWLLKNKQTNRWETTRATAEACYALLLQGTDWLIHERSVEIKLGDHVVKSDDQKPEAGTGYFQTRLEGSAVKPEMGKINVTVSTKGDIKNSNNDKAGTSWGGVYWQYFEDLDKITFAETPLKLRKQLFRQTNTDRGPVLTPIREGDKVKIGDKIKVRIELRVDREMEYVHMKDMRASAMEPVNVLSSYKWQGGLGYYESTKDASTNFFFSWLNRGTYVFEYTLLVTHAGNFSNGITTIQSMYAPEFTAHSEGVRVLVEN
jgi:uncharacterized protein YfaS (alpha-2-macroglobulin family)